MPRQQPGGVVVGTKTGTNPMTLGNGPERFPPGGAGRGRGREELVVDSSLRCPHLWNGIV